MIYEKIKNLHGITGDEACSLTWPLGGKGKPNRDYFLSKSYIGTHIHCQPSNEGDPIYLKDGFCCDGFLTRNTGTLSKDEIETATLLSYHIPDYYGREIEEIIEIGKLGKSPAKNNSADGKRFVILMERGDKMTAVVPEKMGRILPYSKKWNRTEILEGDALSYALMASSKKLANGKVLGLWYTGSELDKTPTVNIEDARDCAMLTMYDQDIKNALTSEDSFFIKNPGPSHEPLITKVLKEKLIGTSGRLSEIAGGNFIAAYNLHDYLILDDGVLKEEGLQSTVPEIYGGAEKFIETLGNWAEERFSNVKLACDGNVPVMLVSDKKIAFKS